jgi:hypothetical protein
MTDVEATTMHTWKGWAEKTGSDAVVPPTWNESAAYMQEVANRQSQQHDRTQQDCSFNHREMARLQFVRWRYHTGRLDPAAPIDTPTTDHNAA